MSGNFVMMTEEDLEKAFAKMLDKYLSTHNLTEKFSTEEDKYYLSSG